MLVPSEAGVVVPIPISMVLSETDIVVPIQVSMVRSEAEVSMVRSEAAIVVPIPISKWTARCWYMEGASPPANEHLSYEDVADGTVAGHILLAWNHCNHCTHCHRPQSSFLESL